MSPRRRRTPRNDEWTDVENTLLVDDYFAMLREDMLGLDYQKARHNRELRARMGETRSKRAVESKHQNVSAVLNAFGYPWVQGYAPLNNFQAALVPAVEAWLAAHPNFFHEAADQAELDQLHAAVPTPATASSVFVPVPPPLPRPKVTTALRTPKGVFIDQALRDLQNRQLGQRGEEFVLEVEQRRLTDIFKRPDLARRVEWVSRTRGDGLGFDILSFHGGEAERPIEVKTTARGPYTPFYVSANELAVSRAREGFHVYRVFDFYRGAHIFELEGDVGRWCELEAMQYRARIYGGCVNGAQAPVG